MAVQVKHSKQNVLFCHDKIECYMEKQNQLSCQNQTVQVTCGVDGHKSCTLTAETTQDPGIWIQMP